MNVKFFNVCSSCRTLDSGFRLWQTEEINKHSAHLEVVFTSA